MYTRSRGRWGVRSLLLLRLTSESRSRIKTLWSPSHMLCSLGTFPQQPDSYWRWIKQTCVSLERVSPQLFSTCASFLSKLKILGNTSSPKLFVHISYFLSLQYIKCRWLCGLTSADKTFLWEHIRAEWKNRLSTIQQFALHQSSYRGRHDLVFLLILCLVSSAAYFTLLPVLYLKTTSGSALAPALQVH